MTPLPRALNPWTTRRHEYVLRNRSALSRPARRPFSIVAMKFWAEAGSAECLRIQSARSKNRAPAVEVEKSATARCLDEEAFVLLFVGAVCLAPPSAIKLQAGLNPAYKGTDGLYRAPDAAAEARPSLFHGFHRSGEDLVGVHQLHAQP